MLECYPVLQISCRWSIFRLTRSAIFFGMFPRILFCPMCNLFYRVNRLVTEFGNMSPKLWAKSNYCRLLQLARELMKFMLSTRQLITVNVEPHWVLHLSLTCRYISSKIVAWKIKYLKIWSIGKWIWKYSSESIHSPVDLLCFWKSNTDIASQITWEVVYDRPMTNCRVEEGTHQKVDWLINHRTSHMWQWVWKFSLQRVVWLQVLGVIQYQI